jgi:hypothetical protein
MVFTPLTMREAKGCFTDKAYIFKLQLHQGNSDNYILIPFCLHGPGNTISYLLQSGLIFSFLTEGKIMLLIIYMYLIGIEI